MASFLFLWKGTRLPARRRCGLCEYMQHLAIFDYLRVSTSLDGRMVEYLDHLENTSSTRCVWWAVGTSCRPRPATASR